MTSLLTKSGPSVPAEQIRSMVCLATEQNRRNSEASILVRGPGSYLLIYTAFAGSTRDDSAATLLARETSDFGLTWSDPKIVHEPHHGNAMSPSVTRLDDAKVGLSFVAKHSSKHAEILWRQSEDDGESWGEPRVIFNDGSYTVSANDSTLRLDSGRLLLPLYSTAEVWVAEEKIRAFCIYSDDQGRTWARSSNLVECPGRGAMEPVLYETEPGHIVMFLRTDQGFIWKSESTDSGISWSEATATTLRSQQAPSAVRRLPGSSTIFLIRNPNHQADLPAGGARTPLVLSISRDLGETWQQDLVLEESPVATYSYPSIAFDESALLVTYYVTKFRTSLGDTPDLRISLCFRRIPLADLRDI